MRERKKAGAVKKLGFVNRRTSRNRLSASNWRTRLVATIGIHNDDWRPRSYSDFLTGSEFTNSIAIIFISAGAVGIGAGQLLAQAVGY